MNAKNESAENARKQDHGALQNYQHLRRIMLAVLITTIGAGLIFVHSSWENETVHELIEIFGVGLITLGILGRLWSTLYIGGKKAATVVSEGPYSVMRNPLYFFSAVAAAGVGAQTGTFSFMIFFGLLTIVAFHIVIHREEKYLSEHFGKTYADYCSTVPRFFPKPSLFNEPQTLEISTRRLYSTFLDGMVFFIALPLFELVEIGQEAGVVPVFLHLY
jgi:protein-S-isoprenylcysteine O-methyltransferase Ste14